MEKIYLVMPAYNEAANLEEVVKMWHPVAERLCEEQNDCKLVIANDGSKDNSFEILTRLKNEYKHLIPLNKANSGHGATVLYLYEYGIKEKADFVFQTDSDGQTLPEEFWPMWENRHQYDFNIGPRGGRQDGLSRVFVTKTLRFIVWIMFGVWVKDANTPFRLMNVKRLESLLNYIPKDYALANVAVSAIAVKKGEKIAWYPITFRPRQGGKNSINMKRIFKIGWKALTDFKNTNKNLKRT